MRRAALLAALLAPALAAACVSDRTEPTAAEIVDCSIRLPVTPDGAIDGVALLAAMGGAGSADSVAVVVIRNFRFSPDTVRIRAGATVVWINCEEPGVEAHTSTADAGTWNSGILQSGDTWGRRFDQAGTFPYFCIPHPFMRAAVIVQP